MKLIHFISKILKQKHPLVGIPVIIKNSNNEILLGKRSNKVFYPNMWGLPGGLVEKGETLQEAAKRELKEEMGIDIKIIKKSANIYEDFSKKECNLHLINIPIYAKIKRNKPKAKDETKKITWFKSSELKKMKLAYNHKEILKKEKII